MVKLWGKQEEEQAAPAPAPVPVSAPENKTKAQPTAAPVQNPFYNFNAVTSSSPSTAHSTSSRFSWLPLPELPYPGKFEDLNKEHKSILRNLDFFDGFRMDFSKAVSPALTINHLISMGGSGQEPASYMFLPSYQNQDTKTMMWARIQTDGQQMGFFKQSVTDNLELSATAEASNEPDSSQCKVDLDYRGPHYHAQAKWSHPTTIGLTYHQSLTKRLSAGADWGYDHAQAMSQLSLGARYAADNWIATVVGTLGVVSLTYTHLLNDKVSVSSEYSLQLTQNGWESVWSMGYQYVMRKSFLRGQIDSNSRIVANLEEAISQTTALLFCGELDHKKKVYRFGVGLKFSV